MNFELATLACSLALHIDTSIYALRHCKAMENVH